MVDLPINVTVHSVCPRCHDHENMIPAPFGFVCTTCGKEMAEPERWVRVDDALKALVTRLVSEKV